MELPRTIFCTSTAARSSSGVPAAKAAEREKAAFSAYDAASGLPSTVDAAAVAASRLAVSEEEEEAPPPPAAVVRGRGLGRADERGGCCGVLNSALAASAASLAPAEHAASLDCVLGTVGRSIGL